MHQTEIKPLHVRESYNRISYITGNEENKALLLLHILQKEGNCIEKETRLPKVIGKHAALPPQKPPFPLA